MKAVQSVRYHTTNYLPKLMAVKLSDSSPDGQERSQMLRVLVKLSQSHGLPEWLYLKDVQRSTHERDAVDRGGFAEIYLGTWNGKTVALKRLRAHKDEIEETKKARDVCTKFLSLYVVT